MSVMLDEIKEDGSAILRTLESAAKTVDNAVRALLDSDYVIITGSGTSYHAGLSLQIALMKKQIPAVLVKAPDFTNYLPEKLERKVAVVILSQSGESVDALEALNWSRKAGATTVGITNEVNSTLARDSDVNVITSAGHEIAIAATKSYISQLAAITLMQGHILNFDAKDELKNLARLVDNLTSGAERFEQYSSGLKDRIVFLGDGFLYGSAQEASLKFRETGNLLTESYQAREYLHGPIQTLDKDTTVVILIEKDKDYSLVLSALKKYTDNILTIGSYDKDSIQLPLTRNEVSPILYAVPIQLLAYYKAVGLGLDPDNPDKLTKVVK